MSRPCKICGSTYRDEKSQCPPCKKEYGRNWYHTNKERQSLLTRQRKYGITPEEIIILLKSQNYNCAICKENIEKNFRVDHDHVTGLNRGLLCNNCNTGLGHFNDNQQNLLEAINYLNIWSDPLPF